jgi:hypothetical protein
MKTTTKNKGIKVTTGIKAGGFDVAHNHSRARLSVKTGLKVGYKPMQNHNARMLAIG